MTRLTFIFLGWGAAMGVGAGAAASTIGDPGHSNLWHTLLLIACLFVGIAGSALFSGLETAIYSMSQLRLLIRVKSGQARSELVRDELKHRPKMIVCLLVATNAFSFLVSFATAAISHDVFGWSGTWTLIVEAAVLTPFLFTFGETIPKEIGRSRADEIVPMFAPALWFVRRLLTILGIMWIVDLIERGICRITGVALGGEVLSGRARLIALLEEGVSHGRLSARQSEIVDRVLALRNVKVAQCMTPWARVRTIRIDANAEELSTLGIDGRYPFYPAVDANGTVVGWADLTALLTAGEGAMVRDHVSEVDTIAPALDARHAIRIVKRISTGIALVGSPNKPLGVVTMKDLVRPLLGGGGSARS